MSNTGYELNAGKILRNGEVIADYANGTLDFLPGMAKYRMPVVKFLKEQGHTIAESTGTVTRKSGVPAEAAQEPATATQNEDQTEVVATVSADEFEALKRELAEARAQLAQASKPAGIEQRITERVKFAPPSEKICDPEQGWIRG